MSTQKILICPHCDSKDDYQIDSGMKHHCTNCEKEFTESNYSSDLKQQIDEINKMIEYNKKKAGEHIESPIEQRTMSEEQYMKLLKRTAMMRECLKEIQKLDK